MSGYVIWLLAFVALALLIYGGVRLRRRLRADLREEIDRLLPRLQEDDFKAAEEVQGPLYWKLKLERARRLHLDEDYWEKLTQLLNLARDLDEYQRHREALTELFQAHMKALGSTDGSASIKTLDRLLAALRGESSFTRGRLATEWQFDTNPNILQQKLKGVVISRATELLWGIRDQASLLAYFIFTKEWEQKYDLPRPKNWQDLVCLYHPLPSLHLLGLEGEGEELTEWAVLQGAAQALRNDDTRAGKILLAHVRSRKYGGVADVMGSHLVMMITYEEASHS